MFESVSNVSIDDLTTALSQFGTRGAAELGYFHGITHADSLSILFKLTIPVVGDLEANYGPNWVRGTIDFSQYGLVTPPKLIGILEGISDDHNSSFNLTNITATSADYIVRQNTTSASVPTAMLDGQFTIIALA